MIHVVTGKPSLSVLFCVCCAEETLHKYGVCIHCQTPTMALIPRLADYGYQAMDERRKSGGRKSKLNPRRKVPV